MSQAIGYQKYQAEHSVKGITIGKTTLLSPVTPLLPTTSATVVQTSFTQTGAKRTSNKPLKQSHKSTSAPTG